jgi:OTU domain-containing protein 6
VLLIEARIQQLKKSVPPNDKKRKKEILVEIAEWESNLDAKHEAELLNLKEINLVRFV